MKRCQLRSTVTVPVAASSEVSLPWNSQDYITDPAMFSTGTPERLFVSPGVWAIKFAVNFPYVNLAGVRRASLYLGPSATLLARLTTNTLYVTEPNQPTTIIYDMDILVTAAGAYLYIGAWQTTTSTMTMPAGQSFLTAHQASEGTPT
jgi:hypothetical protein